jgi:hypothetical protein
MPSVELSVAELKYLANMNGQSIFVMQTMGKKNKRVFPDLAMAERIQAKFAAVLPDGLPDPFAELRATQSQNPRLGKTPRGAKKR